MNTEEQLNFIQWTGENIDKVWDLLSDVFVTIKTLSEDMLRIYTHAGFVNVHKGDYIVRGVLSENSGRLVTPIFSVEPSIFESTPEYLRALRYIKESGRICNRLSFEEKHAD